MPFQPVAMRDIARGLDLRAVQNALPDGYSERARDITFSSSGHASKRVGYQGHCGNLPFRVTEVRHVGTRITFVLDGSIDTSALQSTPLVVYGRLASGGTGDWSTTPGARYYPTFTTDIPDTIPAGFYTFVLPGERYNAEWGTPLFTAMRATSVDPANRSSDWFVPEDVRVDQLAPYDIEIDTTSGSVERVFYFATDKEGVGGDSYTHSGTLPQITVGTVLGAGTTITDAGHDYLVGDVLTFGAGSAAPLVPGTEYVVDVAGATTYSLSGVVFPGAGGIVNVTAKRTYTILAPVHNLNTFKILCQPAVLQSEWQHVYPELFTVDRSSGTLTVQLTTSDTFAARTTRFVFSAVPNANEHTFGGTTSIFTLEPDFYHFGLMVTTNTDPLDTTDEMVLPDALTRNDLTELATIDVATVPSGAGTYKFWFEESILITSALIVEDTTATSETYTDIRPQMTLWGLDHADGIYVDPNVQGGHVTHLDSYRSPAESKLVVGLGGNLFTEQPIDEIGSLIPQSSVDLQVRTGGIADVTIQPALAFTAVTSIAYAGTPGQVTYSFTGPLPTLSASTNDPDLLTVRNAAHAVFNGTFTILAATATTVTVSNPLVTLADWDEGAGAEAGVFTASLTTFEPSELQVGDILTIAAVVGGVFTVVSVASSLLSVRVSGVDQAYTIPPNNLVSVTRTSTVFPLLSSRAFVRGDMIQVGDLTREARVRYVDAVSSIRFATLVHTGATATVTLESPHNYSPGEIVFVNGTSSSDYNGARTILTTPTTVSFTFTAGSVAASPMTLTGVGRASTRITGITVLSGVATATTSTLHRLKVGDKVLLVNTVSSLSGLKTVLSIPSSTTFTYATTATSGAGVTGFIRGGVVELDESLTVTDTGDDPTSATVHCRWFPIEAPETTDDLVPDTIIYHFNTNLYDEQPIMRSGEVADSLFLANYDDEIWKFDGTSIYQAGLPRWQSQLFLAVDTDNPTIPLGNPVAFTAKDTTAKSFTVTDIAPFTVGDRWVDSTDTTFTASVILSLDTTDKKIFVDVQPSATATGSLRKTKRFSYYVRLSAIDANNNVLASAATGAADSVIDLTTAGSIELKLVPPTAWGTLDFDTIEVEVYRTKSDTVAPFYLVRRLDVAFNAADKYILVTDGTLDSFLVDLDDVNTALLGAELGTTWTQPPRAKHVTTAGNRLILGNLRDYSQIDLTLRKKAGVISLSASDLPGKILTFKRDSGTALTTTDMTNLVKFEFRNSGAVTLTPATDITRTTTTFTVASAGHLLVAGDWVYLFHSTPGTNKSLQFAGWWQIDSVVAATSFTVTFNNTFTVTAGDVDRYVTATAQEDVPVWTGTDGNYNQVGLNDGTEFEAILRLAGAINSSQRGASESVDFTPWLFASAGSEVGLGRLVVRQEHVEPTNFSLTLTSALTSANWYAQGVQQTASAVVPSARRLFPSRLVISYENFPELFDNPFGDESESDSVIDVNSADGQEITGVIPFFGESSFATSNSQLETVVVVFKTNSVYLVNLATRDVAKLQSRGLGCTAPFSIAVTQNGIMFANESGIYKLGRDQAITYVGKFIERLWQDDVNRTDMSKFVGHHFAIGNQYKLSVPVGEDQTLNNEVLVYDHQREGVDQEFGAWSEYTNHPATMWANLVNDAYFSTSTGRVFRIRRAGDATDYRDDASAISCDLVLRATDHGSGGVRKLVNSVTSHLQLRHSSQTGTQLSHSADLDGVFQSCGSLIAAKTATNKVATLRSALPRRKAVYSQLRYVNAVKDEEFILSGVDWYLTSLNDRAIHEAED